MIRRFLDWLFGPPSSRRGEVILRFYSNGRLLCRAPTSTTFFTKGDTCYVTSGCAVLRHPPRIPKGESRLVNRITVALPEFPEYEIEIEFTPFDMRHDSDVIYINGEGEEHGAFLTLS